MYELIENAMIIIGTALIMESFTTLIAIKVIIESHEKIIAEIKHNQDLEEKIKEKDSQLERLAKIIREVSEEMKDGR